MQFRLCKIANMKSVCVCVFAHVHSLECASSEGKYMNVAYNDYSEKAKTHKNSHPTYMIFPFLDREIQVGYDIFLF